MEHISRKRRKNIDFHIKSDDYFGTVATVVNLLRQENNDTLEKLRDELLYLQEHYIIIRRKNK